MFLRNCWYVAATAEELGRTLIARTILGEPLVMFRTEAGAPVAMSDRCPHREAPLSRGKLVGDNVECGYHGVQVDACGACVVVPGQAHIPDEAKVPVRPMVEKHGWVWIWMGDANAADPSLIPDFHWNNSPGWVSKGDHFVIKGNYQLIVDNLLDLSHVSYLHPKTIGTETVAEAGIETSQDGDVICVQRWILDTPAPPIWPSTRGFGANGALVDRWQKIYFTPPSHIWIESGGAPSGSGAKEGDYSKAALQMILNGITPETESSTHYFWASARDYALDDDSMTELSYKLVYKTFIEDVDIIEAQQRVLDCRLGGSVIDRDADDGALQARRLVARRLGDERAAA